MRVFADTNVLLDVLVPGRRYAAESAIIFRLARDGGLEMHMTTQSIIDAAYACIRCPGYDNSRFRNAARELLRYVNVGGIDISALSNAVKSTEINDIEDCAQAFYADGRRCDIIVSGDRAFRIPDMADPVPVMTPAEFTAHLHPTSSAQAEEAQAQA